MEPGGPAAPAIYAEGETRWQYAGFWLRFGAILVDGVILGVVGVILLFVLTDTTAALFNFVIGFAYYVLGNGWGGTPGKRLLGLRVVNNDGDEPGLAAGLVRYLVTLISALALFLGYLWMLWDGQRQTWHDKAAGTFVVQVLSGR